MVRSGMEISFIRALWMKYTKQERPPMGPPPGASKYDEIAPDGFPEMEELVDNHYDYSPLQPVQPLLPSACALCHLRRRKHLRTDH